MSPTPIQESETELAQLKQRAQALQAANDQLDRDLAPAVARARQARLSMQEIATHIGIDRTTLYARLKRTNPRLRVRQAQATRAEDAESDAHDRENADETRARRTESKRR